MLNIFSRYFDQIITVVTGEFDCNYSVVHGGRGGMHMLYVGTQYGYTAMETRASGWVITKLMP